MKRKVAVIDCDMKFLEHLKACLACGGYEPIIVSDAMLAIDAVEQSLPDVILMELTLPFKSGFELAARMNRSALTKSIPIIAMSAVFKSGLGPLLDYCGIIRCLKKPFNPVDVIWAIENEAVESSDIRSKTVRQEIWS
jgi:DNA-binding response OmpR family regulator